MSGKLWREENHDHFWIEDEALFESYHTIRGLRYRFRLLVPGSPNLDRLDAEAIEIIEQQYLNISYNE